MALEPRPLSGPSIGYGCEALLYVDAWWMRARTAPPTVVAVRTAQRTLFAA
jgi:hypothetical protein